MEFIETELAGVLLVKMPRFDDDRGWFMEAWTEKAWREAGFENDFVHDSMSLSHRGTVRGMHYQLAPHGQAKLVRAIAGSLYDVAVDIRRGSPTYGKWTGHTLSVENGLAMWIPVGFAHGFQALADDTIMLYKCSTSYVPEAGRALAYDDPTVAIRWPEPIRHLSAKDRDAPVLTDMEANFEWVG